MRLPSKRVQGGYLMYELLAVLAILGALIPLYRLEADLSARKDLSKAAAGHMKRIGNAFDEYVAVTSSILNNSRTTSAVALEVAADPTRAWLQTVPRIGGVSTDNPFFNLCSDHLCTRITCQNLIDAGLLPVGESCMNPAGFTYDMVVRSAGTTTDPQVTSLMAAVKPDGSPYVWLKKDGTEDDFAGGYMALNAGPDAGLSRLATNFDAAMTGGQVTAGQLSLFGKNNRLDLNEAISDIKWSWVDQASRWPNVTVANQVVLRGGHSKSEYAHMLPLDGTREMTGNLGLGGNLIFHLQQNQLNQPCIASDPTLTQGTNNKYIGAVGIIKPTVSDPGNPSQQLGAGNLLTCVYDQTLQQYLWKSPVRPLTAEDGDAGMIDGYETSANWTCNAPTGYAANLPGGGQVSGLGLIKGVFMNGKVYGYWNVGTVATPSWAMAPSQMSGTPIDTVNQSQNQFSLSAGWAALVYDPNTFKPTGGLGCIATGTAGAQLFAAWSFTAQGFSYQVTGAYQVTDPSTSIAAGIPVTVSGTTTTTGVVGTDQTTGQPIMGSVSAPFSATGQTQAGTDQVQTQRWQVVNQTWNYPIARRTKCVPPNPC